jgi:hypothetical protein
MSLAAASLDDYRPHPLAELFPLLDGEAFRALTEDIRQHGVRQSVVMLDGMVLDGRNRYLAARECGASVPTVEYGGDDPLAFVVSLNLNRRHLTDSQLGMVAARIATLPVGANQHAQICAPSQDDAAEMLNVSRRTVQNAAAVQAEGVEALIAEVDAGHVSVSAAAEVAKLPKAEQAEIVKRGKKAVVAKAKEVRTANPARAKTPRHEQLPAGVRERIEAGLLAGESQQEIAERMNASLPPEQQINRSLVRTIKIELDGAAAQAPEPPSLSPSAQQRFERALRDATVKAEARLIAEHTKRTREIDEEIRLRVVERGKKYREAMEQREREAAEQKRWYEKLVNNHKPPLTTDQFMLLHLCIRGDASADKQHLAGVLLNEKRAILTGQKQ